MVAESADDGRLARINIDQVPFTRPDKTHFQPCRRPRIAVVPSGADEGHVGVGLHQVSRACAQKGTGDEAGDGVGLTADNNTVAAREVGVALGGKILGEVLGFGLHLEKPGRP